MRRAVFLDRDGVINAYVYNPEFGTVDSPANPGDFQLLPGVAEALSVLTHMDFLVLVVSNQPGIAKGKFSPALLEAVTQKMHSEIDAKGGKLDQVYYCLHHPEAVLAEYRESCDCRKPFPGLIREAAKNWEIDLSASYLVGDGITDIVAGTAAGVTTIFVSPHKCYICSELLKQNANPDYVATNLPSAVEKICELESGGQDSSTRLEQVEFSKESTYAQKHIAEAIQILQQLDTELIERMANLLAEVRDRGGRLFLIGVGGGAGHASHAVCDFRKICGIEAYAPSDNVSELTARINDDGWDTSYANWLRGSHLSAADAVFVFSVGGGDAERNVSANLVRALQYSKQVGASIFGVVGRNGGYTAQVADACVLIKVANPSSVTPHTEAFQALVWHLLVSHPRLKAAEMKWESLTTDPNTLVPVAR